MVVSLWKINDEAANEVMTLYYKYIQKGHTFTQAITLAQRNFIELHKKDNLNPYLWAPFVLVGDGMIR